MRVAYQGLPGAFSHEACLTFLPDDEPFGRATFAEVIDAILHDEADLGMLPYENNAVGPVEEVQALLADCPLAIVARHQLPIRMHLLGLPGTDLGQVTTAVSHPMALKQCAETLGRMGLSMQPASNTAVAAQALSDPNKAVIASQAAAEAFGLVILQRDVHDHKDNATTFVVLARAAA
jgi:prephenate dehydratase